MMVQRYAYDCDLCGAEDVPRAVLMVYGNVSGRPEIPFRAQIDTIHLYEDRLGHMRGFMVEVFVCLNCANDKKIWSLWEKWKELHDKELQRQKES